MTPVHLLRRATLQLQSLSLRLASTEKVLDAIPSIRHPNKFGTLGHETVRTRWEQLPEEDGDMSKVEFIDGIEGKTRLSTVKYSRLIKKLIDKNRLKEALDVLDERMKSERAKPDRYIYNLLISSCAAHGYTKKAFQLFNQMKKRDITFSGSTYTSLMNACSNSPFSEDGLKRTNHLRELMKEKGHVPNERTYHAMIKAYGRCGELEQAFSVVDEMRDRKKFISNTTYNFLLQACASNGEAGFRHALMVWRKMLERKIKPTIYTYNLLLRCTRDCNVGDMKTFQEDLQKIISPRENVVKYESVDGGPPNNPKLLSMTNNLPSATSTDSYLPLPPGEVVLPNLLLPNPQLGSVVELKEVKNSWHRLSIIGGCGGFLLTMVASQTQPDIKTFSLLLESIEPTIKAEEELINFMKTMKVKLDLDFCNLVIKKRAMSHRFDDAKATMRLIHERSLKPNLVTYGVLALTCLRFEDAKDLIDSIESQGYRINIEIIGALFLRASEYYDLKMMRFVVQKMRQEKIKPNKKFLSHVDNFQKRFDIQLEKAKAGAKHLTKLDLPGFKEEYEKLCSTFEKLRNSGIEDSENIHPWEQFSQKKRSAV